MHSILRRAAVFSAVVALVFFCSCERHHPGELAQDEHAEAGSPESHDVDHPAASPAGTPAQFFPAPTPR